jgi:hypothetical protein
LIALIGLLVLIQIIPYGRTHTNPPIIAEPQWNSIQTLALARRACFSCHSNETEWPWYSHVAPFSWLLQSDVEEGRRHLNFSEWNRPQRSAQESPEAVRDGSMPPWFYLPLHPEAHLSEAERQQLISGLHETFKRKE